MNDQNTAPSLIDAQSLLRKINRKLTGHRTWRRIFLGDLAIIQTEDNSVGKGQYATTHMRYPSAKIIRVKQNFWAVSQGWSKGSLADVRSIGDIIAFQVQKPKRGIAPSKFSDGIGTVIKREGFMNSAILSFRPVGTVLFNPSNPISLEVRGELAKILYALSVRVRSQTAYRLNEATDEHLKSITVMYRPESVDAITRILLDVLGK